MLDDEFVLHWQEGSAMAENVFSPCLEGIQHVKCDQGDMLTKPFLDLCKLILPILGNLSIT